MATDLKYSWATQQQIIGAADGYETCSGTTPVASSDIDLETDGYFGVQIVPEVNFDSTPTDYVDVKVYGSLDGTNYDDTPLYTRRIDKATDPNQISFSIEGYAHLKVTMTQSGSTDSHDVRCYCQRYRGITS